ncbi:MAG TPA: tRNA lysidine(34) synthetase TilS, partial [Paraburkholderia sp.]|uniref:tRNA lysidine(34) synthetase TilS n=1 Tax=Paraburkholderia sp. TaxID=1926495 RepID=UPI002ED19E83
IDDESNADTRYARNALRHQVTPALTVHFPGFRDALARTASHAASAQRLLDELARIDLGTVSRDEGRALSHDALIALDDDRAFNLLRYWMRLRGFGAASSARLGDALRQLREVGAGGDGHRLRIDHAGHALRSYRGLVYWEAGDSNDPADETALTARETAELAWQGEATWRLPQWRGTFVFEAIDPADPNACSADAIPVSVLQRALLSARSRGGGERMRTGDAPGAPRRTLKNLFQERGIPAWKRDVPLLFIGDELLFVPSLGVNRAALPTHAPPTEARVRIVWREDWLIA